MATIKELRQKCGLTQRQFASELGKGLNTIRRWESGAHQPTDKDLPKIAEALGCSVEDLGLSSTQWKLPVNAIGKLREERGLSRQQLATAIGKGLSTLKRWEIGASRPSDKELQKIAYALDCSIEDIRLAPKQEEPMTAIGRIRQERGLSRRQFSIALGKSTAAVFDWENGRSRPPDEDFPKIAKILGCSVEDIWIAPKRDERPATAIGRIRRERGLTQQQLATAVGKSTGAVICWERGECRPSDEDFPKIAGALGCSVEDIWIPPKLPSEQTSQRRHVLSAEEVANMEKAAPYIERRMALGMSISELAEKAGVGETTIRVTESGKSWPIWETRKKIRRALGMPEEKYCTVEERNEIFINFYQKGYIESVIRQNIAMLRANHVDLDDLRDELVVCALRAIERYDPAGAANVNGFVYANLEGCIKSHVRKLKQNIQFESLEFLREAGIDFGA